MSARELTEAEAIALAESEFWKSLTMRERAVFQMNTPRLCMPFSVFHEAIESALGRPVWTHEFGLNYAGIRDELMNGAPPPTFEEIVNLIPEEKRILVAIAEVGAS